MGHYTFLGLMVQFLLLGSLGAVPIHRSYLAPALLVLHLPVPYLTLVPLLLFLHLLLVPPLLVLSFLVLHLVLVPALLVLQLLVLVVVFSGLPVPLVPVLVLRLAIQAQQLPGFFLRGLPVPDLVIVWASSLTR